MMPPTEYGGYYDDDGNPLNPELIPKPALCVSCVKDSDPREEILCNLTRLDQKDEADFVCYAYEPNSAPNQNF